MSAFTKSQVRPRSSLDVSIYFSPDYYNRSIPTLLKMHLLGHHLPDNKLVRVNAYLRWLLCAITHPLLPQIALTSFYGISQNTSSRILSRLQIQQEALVSSLTENQVTALSAYLSSPSTTLPPPPTPFFPPSSSKGKEKEVAQDVADPLDNLKIETDLRRSMQADILHHRTIGTYRGRR